VGLPIGSLRARFTGTFSAERQDHEIWAMDQWMSIVEYLWIHMNTPFWSMIIVTTYLTRLWERFLSQIYLLPATRLQCTSSNRQAMGIPTVWVDPSVKHTSQAGSDKEGTKGLSSPCATHTSDGFHWPSRYQHGMHIMENTHTHTSKPCWPSPGTCLEAIGIRIVVHQASRLTRP
jgi:hypothetical protein